jgi:tetratricopeptide (TPR) repeat protein
MLSLILDKFGEWLFHRTLDKVFTPGIWRRVESATNAWAKALPDHLYVRATAMVPSQVVDAPELSRLRQTLQNGHVPPLSLWDAALKDQWMTRRSLKGDLQPFFASEFEVVASYIHDLATALYRVCAEDPKPFQMEMLRRTDSLPQTPQNSEVVVEHSEWNRRIDEGKQLANDEKWTAALELFRQIESDADRAKVSDAKVWYRLNMNMGSSLLALGQKDAARPHLVQALDYQEEDLLALSQLAQLEMLSDDSDHAIAYARRAIARDPHSEAAWSALIQSESLEFSLIDIPEALRTSQTILAALGSTALRRGNGLKALDYLREALRSGGRDPQVLLILAETLLMHSSAEVPFRGLQADTREEIIRLSTEAITLLEERDQPQMLSRAFFVRGATLADVGDGRGTEDLQRADQLGHGSAGPKHSLARALLKQGKPEAALFFLDQIPGGENEVQIQSLRARVLTALGRNDEVESAIRAALAASGSSPDPALLFDTIDTALEAEQLVLAEELLGRIPAGQGGYYELVLQARLKYARQDINSAMQFYEAAFAMSPTEDRSDLAFECAMQSLRSGMPEKAREYFEISNVEGRGETALRGFVHSLLATGHLERAAGLLEAFAKDEELPDWALEMASDIALQRDDLPRATADLRKLLAIRPDDVNARIHLAYVLLRTDHNAELEEILAPITESKDVSAHNLARAAQLYSNAGHSHIAIALIYRAVRLEPRNPELKRIYIKFFLERDADNDFTLPTEVGAETYVKLTEVSGSQEMEYYLVSDTPHSGPVPEIALDEEIAERLCGKHVGDEVAFHIGTLSETTYRIAEIKNGFIHMFQTIYATFRSQHPEFSKIQMFKVDESKPLDSFTPMFVSVDRKAAEAEDILELYSTRGLPLGFVAKRGGVSLQEAYNTLINHASHRLLVQEGDSESRVQSLAAVSTTRQVIVTLSGLLTLHRLGRLDLMLSLGRTLVGPQSLVDDINEDLRDLTLTERRGGLKLLAKVGEGYQMIESGQEPIRRAVEELETILNFVKTNVEIHPRPFTSLSERDEKLREAITASAYDAFVLSGSDVAIFADDIGLQRLASSERRAGCFSTSILLEAMHAQGVLSRSDFHRDVIKLIGMNHSFIPVSADLLYDALVAEAFQISPLILKTLDRLSTTEVNFASAARVGAELLKKLAMSPLGNGAVEPVATLIFERLTRGLETRPALLAFDEVLQGIFNLLPREYARIRSRMDTFLASRGEL